MTQAAHDDVHRLSPSSFGRAFEVSCERHFKLSLLTQAHTPEPWLSLKVAGRKQLSERLVTAQILSAGHAWEEEALARPEVSPHLVAPPGEGPLSERRWALNSDEEVTRSLEVLTEAPVGALIYQLKLRPPPSLYERLGLSADELTLRDNLPDLVQVLSRAQVEREALGQLSFSEWLDEPIDRSLPMAERVFRVIDLKRSAKVKPSHRAQVYYYAIELDELIKLGHFEGSVDLKRGGVWLGGEPGPERVSLSAVAPYVLSSLRELPSLLNAEVEALPWRLTGRCESCDYWAECSAQAAREDHLSRVTGLSQGGAEALRALGATTVESLPSLLSEPSVEETLQQVASLEGRLPILKARAESYQRQEPVELGRLSQLLPQSEDIAVFLSAQGEPVSREMWAYGLLVQDPNRYIELPQEPLVLVAQERDQCAQIAAEWLCALDEVWTRVQHLNQERKLKLTLQVYCYSDLERRLLQEGLAQMRSLPTLSSVEPRDWSEAQRRFVAQIDRALYVLQGAETIGERRHPREVRELPVVPLLSALVGRYALPIDVVYTLPEVAAQLHLSPPYPRSDERHDPYNHQLRPDAAIELWSALEAEGALDPQVRAELERRLEESRADLSARLLVYASLLERLRGPHPQAQVRRLTPFSLPSPERLSHPDLSRLAFLTRQERIQERRGAKQLRFEGALSARRYATLPLLRSLGEGRFEVLQLPRDQRLEVDGFADLILVEASDDGLRRAAMISDDEVDQHTGIERAAFVKVIRRLSVSDSSTEGLRYVEVGDVIALCEARRRDQAFGDQLPTGLELFLCERYKNFTDNKLHKALKQHSDDYAQGESLFVSLLEDPNALNNELHYPAVIQERLMSAPPRERLTESQRAAWDALSAERVSAIWGPPGTGKTHFLASYLLGVLYAHEQSGERLTVLISAMTNAGIDNLIDKVAELAWAEHQRWGAPLPMIVRGKKAQREPTFGVNYIANKRALAAETSRLSASGSLILGLTQWGLADLKLPVDLLVIDEASQLLVGHASVGFSKLSPQGRVIVAGDHKQLGPVLKGDWGRDELERRLAGSIFDLVRGAETRAGIRPHQLLENFRMNRPLTALSQAIYGASYVCASDEVAERSLSVDLERAEPSASAIGRLLAQLKLPEELPLFQAPSALLRSLWGEAAVTLVIMDGYQASRLNPLESALVGLCVESLRSATPSSVSDESFWREELFVIGPHNKQNDLTREALKATRAWSTEPFVQTVDKAQGQEARCVLISYGVSDPELILAERDFIYDLNRLNVSVTRAQCKAILFLSRSLLDGDMSVLNSDIASAGLSYMQQIEASCRAHGRAERFELSEGASIEVLSLSKPN